MSSLEPTLKGYRSGFVGLIGRPNVGKSTLVNQLVGEKVCITSPVAQTTRNRLRAILTTPKAQLVLVDTPGIHKPHHLLGQRLVQSSRKSIGEVDSILLIFEGCHRPGKGDVFVVDLLKAQDKPVLIVLNKWDLLLPKTAQKRKEEYQNLFEKLDWPIFCCSAINGDGCEDLIDEISNILPISPKLYPADMVSDQPEEILLGELIREQILFHTREEVPHSVAVKIERMEERPSKEFKKSKQNRHTLILATVFVERKSQKGILIGKGGAMLKKIGQGARIQMQVLISGPVYLELFVKVVPNWRSKPSSLADLGYKGD
ncbi:MULTISPECIES: GTPase Era [Prochlorococcus]|uniref:GTPase Era n=1 Tax=Prochlorococcus TaxID=1218 RepID=UPI00053394EA|nr:MULTISPECIES: GTPase Era [Prochlorococcus]KGG12005.1 GTP-binding protein Era [Prochlorococcus sp. MIT 0601]